MKIKIITDSNCGLPQDYINTNEIEVIPFSFFLDDIEYKDELKSDLSTTHFYKKMRNGSKVSTSQISPLVFADVFSKYLNQGYSVIYIGFSSAMSGTLNNASLAKQVIQENSPETNIAIIDSLNASSGQGLLVQLATELIKEDLSFDEVVSILNEKRKNISNYFIVDSLEYLKRGGRISATNAAFGYLLEIKPILKMDENGSIASHSKVRGRKKSIDYLVQKVEEDIKNMKNSKIVINHADCKDEAELIKEKLIDHTNINPVILHDLGPVIGCHSGPGTISVAYINE